MQRHLASLLSACLAFLVCFCALGPVLAQGSKGPTVESAEELGAEKAWFAEHLGQANKELEGVGEKEGERRILLQLVRDQCQEGLGLVQRYYDLSLKLVLEPATIPDSGLQARKDFSLSRDLLRPFYDMGQQARREAEAKLKELKRRIESELQVLDGHQRSLVSALGKRERQLAETQGRNEGRIRKERGETEKELSEIEKRLGATPKPEGELAESLEAQKRVHKVKLLVLDRELRGRQAWMEWLTEARGRIQQAIEAQKLRQKEYLAAAAAVDGRLSRLKVFQLPVIALPPTPYLNAEQRSRVEAVLRDQRGRIERSIGEVLKTQNLKRRLESERVQMKATIGSMTALIDKQLQRTSEERDESASIRSFRLQMAIKALERERDRSALEGITWKEIRQQNRRQAQQLEDLELQIEDIRERVERDLRLAVQGPLDSMDAVLTDYVDAWIQREEKESRALRDVTVRTLSDLLSLQGDLDHRRALLLAATRTLEARGLFLQDPQRLILRGQGIRNLFLELGTVFWRLASLPIEIFHTAVHLEPEGGGSAWRLYLGAALILGAIVLSFRLHRRAGGMQESILASAEPERTQVFRLTVMGWIYRILPWLSLGLAFLFAARLFLPGSQDARLCIATGKFFLFASFWIVTSRVLLRPAKPKLRFFVINDHHARRLYRIVNFGLVFWLLGLVGEMMGALLSGGQGRIFQAALQALSDGGLLLMAFFFFKRKAFLKDLFPAPEEGGLRFLQAFVMTVLWPIRIFLVLSLCAWLLTYYDLAHSLGVWIMGGFCSLLLAVAFHQIFRHEVNDRFLLHRYSVDEESLSELSDAEREALLSDRNKVAKLVASFSEIVEFLVSILLFLGMVAWFYGLDGTGIQALLDQGIWGSPNAKNEINIANLLGFCLAVFLTLALSRRSGPTIDYLLEKRTDIDRGMRYTMGTLSGYLVFVVGMGIAFSQLSIGFAQVSWILAALGVGIGFGLQDIVSNFFSGLILLFERPLRVGDVVRVGDTLGEVKKITIRSTTVTSYDNIDVIVPNKDFISSSITNWTSSDRNMRSTIDIGVAYGSDLKRVRQVLIETVCKHGRVFKKPAPSVFAKGFGDSSIDFAVVYWTLLDYKRGTFSDLHFAIEAAFSREGIEIPFPQRDINFSADEAIPVVIRGEEQPGKEDPPAAAAPSDKRKDDREIRRMSSKTEASSEVEAEDGGDTGGESDL